MKTDLVTAAVDGFHFIGVFVHPQIHQKESGFHAVPIQCGEDLIGMLRAPGGIEGQGDGRVFPFHAVYGLLPADGGGLYRRGNKKAAGNDGGAEEKGGAAFDGENTERKFFHKFT